MPTQPSKVLLVAGTNMTLIHGIGFTSAILCQYMAVVKRTGYSSWDGDVGREGWGLCGSAPPQPCGTDIYQQSCGIPGHSATTGCAPLSHWPVAQC